MADYINKNILSQAYIHIEPAGLSTDEQLANFKIHISKFARSRVDFFLHPGLEIDIEFEEGSLKSRITVIGALGMLLHGICNYTDFKEGVSAIFSDSKRLAEYIVSEAQFQAGSKYDDVIHLEARTGIIGSLHKITAKLDTIQKSAKGTSTAKELSKKMLAVQEDIEELLSTLEDPNDLKLVKSGLKSLINEIPKIPKDPKGKPNPPINLAVYKVRLDKLKTKVAF